MHISEIKWLQKIWQCPWFEEFLKPVLWPWIFSFSICIVSTRYCKWLLAQFIKYIKCEQTFYVSYPSYFQQSNLNQELKFKIMIFVRLYSQVFPNSQRYFGIFGCCFGCTYCRRKRVGPNLRLNYQFSRKIFIYIYITALGQFACWEFCFQAWIRVKIATFSWGGTDGGYKTNLERTAFTRLHLALFELFWICNNIFTMIDKCRFFTFGRGPDILINMLKDYITFLVWAAWFLVWFILS